MRTNDITDGEMEMVLNLYSEFYDYIIYNLNGQYKGHSIDFNIHATSESGKVGCYKTLYIDGDRPYDEIMYIRGLLQMNNKGVGEMEKKDVILLLLYYGGIRGKTIMRMQVFLAYTEIFKEKMPGTDIENEIADLINEGKIIRYNSGEGHAAYYITDKGVEYIKKVRQNISNDTLIKLGNNKVDWDEWGLMGIALYISRNYPGYAAIEEKYRW